MGTSTTSSRCQRRTTAWAGGKAGWIAQIPQVVSHELGPGYTTVVMAYRPSLPDAHRKGRRTAAHCSSLQPGTAVTAVGHSQPERLSCLQTVAHPPLAPLHSPVHSPPSTVRPWRGMHSISSSDHPTQPARFSSPEFSPLLFFFKPCVRARQPASLPALGDEHQPYLTVACSVPSKRSTLTSISTVAG